MDLVTPGIGLVFWMVVSFLIVLLILKKFAWKPILKLLKDRETSIEEALTSATEAKNEMAKLKVDNEKILNSARIERDGILKDAREIKDKILKDAKEQAVAETSKILESARAEIEHMKALAMNEIKNQVASLSIDIAEKILKRELDGDNLQKAYVEELLKDIKLN